jgi:curved DNA-binding protein CbpA
LSEFAVDVSFRRLAKLYYPDRNPDDRQATARYDEVLTAYGILGDKTRREQYDRLGYAGLQGSYQWGNRVYNFQGAERDAIDKLLNLFGDGGNPADSGRLNLQPAHVLADPALPSAAGFAYLHAGRSFSDLGERLPETIPAGLAARRTKLGAYQSALGVLMAGWGGLDDSSSSTAT